MGQLCFQHKFEVLDVLVLSAASGHNRINIGINVGYERQRVPLVESVHNVVEFFVRIELDLCNASHKVFGTTGPL